MRRPSNTKLNAIALYANFIVLAVIGLLANPLQVRFLGVEAFGIWKALLRILDLTSVADGRATQALKWIVAHKSSQDDDEHLQREVGSAIAVWLMWLPILLIAIGCAVWFLPAMIKGIPAGDLGTARLTAALLGLNVMLTALLGIPDSVLAGTNQGFRSYVVTTAFLIVSNIGMVAAGWLGFGITGMAVATLAGSLMTGAVALLIARRYVRWWGIRRPSWSDVKSVLAFSNWTQVWSLVQMFMLSTEVLLIGYLIGPGLVGQYAFMSYVGTFAISICLMTGSAVAPKLGALVGAGKVDEARELHDRTREFLLCIALTAACGLVLCNRAFVSVWAGPQFFIGDMANLGMVAVMVQLVMLRFDAQIQDVGLQIRNKVIAGSIGALLALVLGAAAYRITGGLPAMFAGMFVGRLPLNVLFPIQVRRLIPNASINPRGIMGLLIAIGASAALGHIWQPSGWVGLLLGGLASIALAATVSLVFVLSRDSRQTLQAILRRAYGRPAGRKATGAG